MAITQVSNIQLNIIPELVQKYVVEMHPDMNAFQRAGILMPRADHDQQFLVKNSQCRLQYWNIMDHDAEPDLMDDTENVAPPLNSSKGEMKTRKLYYHKSWKMANFAQALGKENPNQVVAAQIAGYWDAVKNRILVAEALGIYADNIANDASDMVNDVSGATNNDVNANTRFSAEAMVDAMVTSGEHMDDYTAVAVHPIVYARMKKSELIEYVQPAGQNLQLPTYLGKYVVVDKRLPFTAATGTGGTDAAAKYTSILFAPGAFGFGEEIPAQGAAYVKEEPDEGHGAGTQKIGYRKHWIIHPNGFDWQESNIGGASPTIAEISEAAQWDRKYQRENVKIAFLITNG